MGKHLRRRSRTDRAAAYSVLVTRVRLKREASYPPCRFQLLGALETCIRDIFTGLREEFFSMTQKRRDDSSLTGNLQVLELQIDSQVLNQLIAVIDSDTTRALLPQVDDLVRSETEDLLSTMLSIIRQEARTPDLCAGFVCDAHILMQAIIDKLKESTAELQVVLERFFEESQVLFYKDLVQMKEVRTALEWVMGGEGSEVGDMLGGILGTADRGEHVQVSYSTADLLQQMSIEQVLLYINAEDDPESKGKKKRKRGKKKPGIEPVKQTTDLGSLTEEEFNALAADFQMRLESSQQQTHRGCPKVSSSWVNRLMSELTQLRTS